MTVAAVFLSETGVYALSDLLVSSMLKRDPDPKLVPNTHPSLVRFPTMGISLMQKSIVIGSHLILWAGPVRLAKMVLYDREFSVQTTREEIADYIRDLDDAVVEELSIIHVYFDRETNQCVVTERGAVQFSGDGIAGFACGSGCGDFFWDQFGRQPQDSSDPSWSALICYMSEFIFRERADAEHWQKAYGSGYEIICLANNQFQKLNYRLDVFGNNCGNLAHHSSVYYDYVDDVLNVLSVFPVPLEDRKGTEEHDPKEYFLAGRSVSGFSSIPRVSYHSTDAMDPKFYFGIALQQDGFSVRCFKEDPLGLNLKGNTTTVTISRQLFEWVTG